MDIKKYKIVHLITLVICLVSINNKFFAAASAASKKRKADIVTLSKTGPKKKKKRSQEDQIIPAVPIDSLCLDEIKVVIFTQEGTEIITKSDVERPNLSGMQKPLDALVFERLVFLDAKKHKVVPDDAMRDKYVRRVLHENNMESKDLEKMFENAGRSLKEGLEELRMLQAVNAMISNKVNANIFVSRQEVQAYYDAHPQEIEASYLIARAVVPFAGNDQDAQKQSLAQQIERKQDLDTLGWGQPFWIADSEIADDKRFILDMCVGQVSKPQKIVSGFELYRVLEKKESTLRSLDDCYQEISDILVRPKYEQILENYRKSLLETASIVYY